MTTLCCYVKYKAEGASGIVRYKPIVRYMPIVSLLSVISLLGCVAWLAATPGNLVG